MFVGLAFAATLWTFLVVTDEVREGGTGAVDRAVLLAFRMAGDPTIPLGPRWLQETERDITALGGFTVLTLISILAVGLLVIFGRRLQALIYTVAIVATQATTEAIKAVIARPRPDLVVPLDLTYSSSFPSGHATMAPMVYLTLAAIVCAGLKRPAARLLIMGAAALLVVAIGVSRVYLGVHWPSDVLGGWTLGFAAALCASVALHRVAPRGTGGDVIPDSAGAA